jgi:hypothetical protein
MQRENKMDEVRYYRIRIRGTLGSRWAEWFAGLMIVPRKNGDTVLSGPIVDQAMLFGILKRIRDAGMTLVSVNSRITNDH